MDRSFKFQWTRATLYGWALGFAFIAAMRFIWDAAGFGDAQFIVGLGIGLGTAITQRSILKSHLPNANAWVWTGALGMTIPFAMIDFFGADAIGLEGAAAFGGLLTGFLQRSVLQKTIPNANLWIILSTIGWVLSVTAFRVSETVPLFEPSWLSTTVVLALILTGGLILGVVSGFGMNMMLREDRSELQQ